MKNFFWLLVGAIVALLVPAVLSEPINNLFSGDRLVGTMKIADWKPQPVPTATDDTTAQSNSDAVANAAGELVKLADELANLTTKHTYATLTLKNNSDEVVNNVRIKFDTYAADVLLDRPEEQEDVFQRSVQEITVPEMKQGDELSYDIWTRSSSPEYLKDDIETFSSTGPIRMTYVFPESEWETERSTFEWVVEDWFPYIGLGLLLLFAVGMAIVNSHYETLIKGMLKDRDVYDEERQKYETDPQKYNPVTSNPKPKTKT